MPRTGRQEEEAKRHGKRRLLPIINSGSFSRPPSREAPRGRNEKLLQRMQDRTRVEPGEACIGPHDTARLRPRRQRTDLTQFQGYDDVDASCERFRGLLGCQTQGATQIAEEACHLGGHHRHRCRRKRLRGGRACSLRTHDGIRSRRLIAFTHDQRHKRQSERMFPRDTSSNESGRLSKTERAAVRPRCLLILQSYRGVRGYQ